jgi:hypothetical protein
MGPTLTAPAVLRLVMQVKLNPPQAVSLPG